MNLDDDRERPSRQHVLEENYESRDAHPLVWRNPLQRQSGRIFSASKRPRLADQARERAEAAKKRLREINAEIGIAALRATWNRKYRPDLNRLLRERAEAELCVELLPLLQRAAVRVRFWATYRPLAWRDASIDLSFLDEPRDGPGTGRSAPTSTTAPTLPKPP